MDNLEICRLCLKRDKELLNIFSDNLIGISVWDKIQKYLYLHIKAGGNLSKSICLDCLARIKDFDSFFKEVEANQIKYQKDFVVLCDNKSSEQSNTGTESKICEPPAKWFKQEIKEEPEFQINSDHDFLPKTSLELASENCDVYNINVKSEYDNVEHMIDNNSERNILGGLESRENTLPVTFLQTHMDLELPNLCLFSECREKFATIYELKEHEKSHFQCTRSISRQAEAGNHENQLKSNFTKKRKYNTEYEIEETNMNELLQFKHEVMTELNDIKWQNEEIKVQQEELVKIQGETLVHLKYFIKCKTARGLETSRFPIQNKESLEKLEKDIEHHEGEILAAVKRIIFPGTIRQKLQQLFSQQIILDYNFNGVQGKNAFKNFKNINNLLFNAISEDGYTETEYIDDIKAAFKVFKNRYHKKICLKKKKLQEPTTSKSTN